MDGLLDDVLEEVPEFDTVSSSGLRQIILFPVISILIIVLIPFILSVTLFRGTNSPLARDFPFDSVEGFLLGTAMEDINAQREELNEKDLTIRRLQQQLGNLDGTLSLVGNLVDEALVGREQALKAETEAILSDERIRLTALEYSEEEMERSLSRLQRSLEADFEDKMDEFESREMSVYQDRIENMRAEREGLEKALNAAVEERKALAKALEDSEEQLLDEYSRSAGFRTTDTSVVEADMERLIETRKTENYWLDELANQYLELLIALNTRDNDAAARHLEALESLFTDERIAEIPGFAVRNEADRELVRFFRAYIIARDEIGVDDLITESLIIIEQAMDHTRAGRLQEASVAWERVAALWPLMESAIDGSRIARESVMARDIKRYASLAGFSLDAGELDDADLIWKAGLEEIPDPVGGELLSWWNRRSAVQSQRQSDQEADFRNSIVAYESELSALNAENRKLLSELTSLRAAAAEETLRERSRAERTAGELDAARARIEELESLVTEKDDELSAMQEFVTAAGDGALQAEVALELEAAMLRVAELERAVTELEQDLAKAQATENRTAKWTPFGVVVGISGETIVIEPYGNVFPVAGDELRVMRSLGGDRVIYLADGILLEIGPVRAVGTLSSEASGAEVYGSPRVDDLIYVNN